METTNHPYIKKSTVAEGITGKIKRSGVFVITERLHWKGLGDSRFTNTNEIWSEVTFPKPIPITSFTRTASR